MVPFRRRKSEQIEEIFLGMWPTVTSLFTIATANGSAVSKGSYLHVSCSLITALQMSP